jgi:hypothetical protein
MVAAVSVRSLLLFIPNDRNPSLLSVKDCGPERLLSAIACGSIPIFEVVEGGVDVCLFLIATKPSTIEPTTNHTPVIANEALTT